MAAPHPAGAVDFPDWAYPAVPPHVPEEPEAVRRVPGSPLSFTQGQIDSGYGVADWYPDEHPPMPRIVSHGGAPPLRACAMCHLPNGAGHPETAGLAGQPVGYAMQQLLSFREGNRVGPRAASMLPIVRSATDAELLAASEYFASLPPVAFTRVVETLTVPRTYLGLGAVRYPLDDGSTERLGERIIEIPEDPERARSRDGHSGFVAHVPPGSVGRGRALVQAEGQHACVACHGQTLGGGGDIPGIAGRSVLSTYRALNDYRLGLRNGAQAEVMREVAAGMDQSAMISIAAYLATLPP